MNRVPLRVRIGHERAAIGQRSRASAAFTLIELLVVITIVSILAAILMPVFAQTREAARTTVCLSNTRQIGMGILLYSQDYDESVLPWSNCTPAQRGYLSTCSLDASHASVWTDTIQPYLKSKDVLSCPSFNASLVAQAMDAATCDGNGTPGSASTGIIPADGYLSGYGLAYPLTLYPGCDTTGAYPYAKYPASGWVTGTNTSFYFQQQALAGVVNAARTTIVADAATYQNHDSSGPFVGTLFGCEGKGRHKGGVNLTFLDGHSKWISGDPESYLDRDESGCYYERYYTVDR